jgi:ATP-dependent helicase/nuclease subunit A
VTLERAMPPLADEAARQRVTTDLDRTFLVEAAAGTGKTTTLVTRIVNVIAAGRVTMDRLVAITFTEAAAAELRDRIREALERAAADTTHSDQERSNCQRAVQEIDQAAISTIHAFAGLLLRTFPIEAGLPPGFSTLDEIQQALLFDERFDAWFWRDALQEPRRNVVRRAMLLGFGQASFRRLAAALEDKHDLLRPETVWEVVEPPPALPVAQVVGRRLTQLQRCVPYALDGAQDPLVQTVLSTRSSARELLRAQTEDEALSALLSVGRLRAYVEHPERWSKAKDGRNAGFVVKKVLEEVNDRIRTVLDAHRSATLGELLGFVRDFVLDGVAQRRAEGVATFHDLLTWTRDLLRDSAVVRHAAQSRYQRIFIDEFQDTDPLQAEIAFYLAADEREGRALPADWRDTQLVPGKLFVVCDPKQSIYRFRGADITLYDDLLERLADARERLTHNFRSVRSVLDWVNHHFDRHMQSEPGIQPEYVPLSAHWAPHPDAVCGVRRIGGPIDGSAADAADAEARTFAMLTRSAVDDGWLVSDRDSDGVRMLRPAAYSDICILLPARTHLRQLERALEDVGVPYRVEAGKLVLATQEVRDLLACLRAIEDPSDQVALVAALRSPAFACSDVDLLGWVEGGGQLDHEHPGDGPEGPVKQALTSLAEFHQRRLLLSPPALIEAFVAERLLVAAAFGESRPREAWRRLRYVVSRARAFTVTGRHTLRAFLDWIEGLQRADVRDPEAGSAEPDEDAIHIQTIHGAKGLEYPIVLLGGLGSNGRARYGGVEVIADRRTGRLACRAGEGWQTPDFAEAQAREKQMAGAEAIRLLYVATTRAKDHLVLSLFRGSRSEESSAALIERYLADAAPDLCAEIAAPAYAPREPEARLMDESLDVSAAADAEARWIAERFRRIQQAAAPVADSTWWSSEDQAVRASPLLAPAGAECRRNVSLLARVEGVLIEERADLAYRSRAGYVVVLRGPDEPTEQVMRAGRVALAFEAATGLAPVVLEVVTSDGSVRRIDDVSGAAARAGAELRDHALACARGLSACSAPNATYS